MDFAHLWGLGGRGVWWVTRAKDNMAYRVRKRLLKRPSGKVLRDDLIYLGQVVPDGATGILWDSRRELQDAGRARERLPAGAGAARVAVRGTARGRQTPAGAATPGNSKSQKHKTRPQTLPFKH